MNDLKDSKGFWDGKLGIGHSALLVIFLAITGALIDLFSGKSEAVLPYQPLNLIIASCCVIVAVIAFILFKGRPVLEWIGSSGTAVAAIGFLAAYSAFKGVFHSASASGWPFVLNLVLLTVNLSLAILKHLGRPRLEFLLNHVGCLMVIIFSMFCNADKLRTDIFVHAGKTAVHGIGADGSIFELPFAINLRSFDSEDFVSKVTLVTRKGSTVDTEISVNHPLTLGRWKIYQHSYQDDMSIFQAVLDPWLYHVYSGLFMLFIGTTIFMFRRTRC